MDAYLHILFYNCIAFWEFCENKCLRVLLCMHIDVWVSDHIYKKSLLTSHVSDLLSVVGIVWFVCSCLISSHISHYMADVKDVMTDMV